MIGIKKPKKPYKPSEPKPPKPPDVLIKAAPTRINMRGEESLKSVLNKHDIDISNPNIEIKVGSTGYYSPYLVINNNGEDNMMRNPNYAQEEKRYNTMLSKYDRDIAKYHDKLEKYREKYAQWKIDNDAYMLRLKEKQRECDLKRFEQLKKKLNM